MGIKVSSVSPGLDSLGSLESWTTGNITSSRGFTTYTLSKNPRDGTKFVFYTVEGRVETFTIVKRIAKSNAKVYLCKNNKNEHVAIKTNKIELDKNILPGEACSIILENVELIRSQSLEHVTEVQNSYYYPNSPEKQYVYTVMAYYEHGDLENYIEKNSDQIMPQDTVLSILKQISHALANLHLQDIVHRDIKPANILVTKIHNNVVKRVAIADYETVRQIEGTDKYTQCGTRCYTSPEVLTTGIYNTLCDIWSLGIVAIELMLGEKQEVDIGLKMCRESEAEVHKEVKEKLKARNTYSKSLIKKVLKMISLDPEDRDTAYDINTWCTDVLHGVAAEEEDTNSEWCAPSSVKNVTPIETGLAPDEFEQYKTMIEIDVMEENVRRTRQELGLEITVSKV